MRPTAATKSPPKKNFATPEIYSVAFGLFLGLAIWKFGNPVILDQIIATPANWTSLWADAWPLHWAHWLLLALTLIGAVLFATRPARWPATRWLLILPIIWFVWQLISAAFSPYHDLTNPTLWQYAGCLVCYLLGALVIGNRPGWPYIMLGILAAFAFCAVRAVNQKLFEFPREKQFLLESQRMSWTNMPPETFQEFKRENIIINTNGVDIANPAIIAKYNKGRVQGTLVYPNALAGIVLLLFPATLVLVWQSTRKLRRVTCIAAITLTVFLGLGSLVWSGSKSGWLIALAIGAFWLFRLKWPPRLKWLLAIVLIVGGLAVFGLRFQSYFAKGATSVGARFDYWQVAGKVSLQNPAFGTGPGTFQRPYASLKRPDSEMARLVHNDYLEQFSDSGFIGGLSYLAWLILLLWTIGHQSWTGTDWLKLAIFAGLLGWFGQGFIEFSLFVPALAWTAFALAGCLLAQSRNQVDKSKPTT